MICARDAATLDAARERASAALAARGQRVVAAPPTSRSDDDVARLIDARARRVRPTFTSWSTTPASTARWGRSRRSTGPSGCGRSRSISTARCCRAARCCRTSSGTATARSSSCPAAARPTRCRASAPTRRRRPRSCASPRRWPRGAATIGIDVNAIAPGALNTRMLDEVSPPGPSAVGQAFYERMMKHADEGGTPLERAPRSRSSSASAASDGITGRLLSAVWDPWAELPQHRDELDADRHLHAAPHRARRIAARLGRPSERCGVAIVGCGLIGRKRARGARRRAAGRLRRRRPRAARAALAARRPGAAAMRRLARTPSIATDVDVVDRRDDQRRARRRSRAARSRPASMCWSRSRPRARVAELDAARSRRPRGADVRRPGRLQPPLSPGAAEGARARRRRRARRR